MNLIAILAFLVTIELITGNERFQESLLGKATITFVVLGTVVPWIFAMEKLRDAGRRKQMILCFVSTAFGASYFLFRLKHFTRNVGAFRGDN